MTNKQKIIALAKLDPDLSEMDCPCGCGLTFWCIENNGRHVFLDKLYSNGDEIRRLIGKVLDTDLKQKFLIALKSILHIPCGAFAHEWFLIVTATPEQLAEALLKATGNWKD